MFCPICGHEAEYHNEQGCHDLHSHCECPMPLSQIKEETGPQGLMDVFEKESEQGKIDMYAEALSDIEQLEGFLKEKDAIIKSNGWKRVDTEETLIVEIMALAYLVQRRTSYCVFISWSGHVDGLEVRICESRQNYLNSLFSTEFYIDWHHKHYDANDKISWLKTKRDVLKYILEQGEIPYDEMERVVEEIVHYEF